MFWWAVLVAVSYVVWPVGCYAFHVWRWSHVLSSWEWDMATDYGIARAVRADQVFSRRFGPRVRASLVRVFPPGTSWVVVLLLWPFWLDGWLNGMEWGCRQFVRRRR